MKKNKAFTLIELLVVIGIIGILGSFVFVQTSNFLNSGKDSKRKSDVAMLASGVASYLSESVSLPVSTGCDINSTCSNEINQIFEVQLGTLPTEPNSNAYYKYQSDGTDCSVSAVLSTGKTYQYSCSTDEITTETPTTGVCGSLSNTTSTAYAESVTAWPSSDFCSSGTVSSTPTFPSAGSSTTWTCPGQYLGESSECTAYHALNGVCGTKNGKYASITPTGTEACVAGTVSGMTGSYSWTCTGQYSGTNASCATVAVTYAVISFTTVGETAWTVPSGVNFVDYLVVAGGGGGGGNDGGGGGGGGMLAGTLSVTPESSVSIVVGAGGSGSAYHGSSGDSSSFSSVSATGGGGGGTGPTSYDRQGFSGGSGGGGAGAGTGGAGTPDQGNNGGAGRTTTSEIYFVGGGGGGAGGIGSDAYYNGASYGGNGGIGAVSSITGSSVYYAGGGGGAGSYNIGVSGGSGGLGGGGAGGYGGRPGTAGTVNTGGGGGGGSTSGQLCGACGYSGGSGGSGIVIIRYADNN